MSQWRYREYPEQYLANTNPLGDKEFHDLANEDNSPNACQIDEIINSGHDKPYESKLAAKLAGYDPCAYCMPGESKR